MGSLRWLVPFMLSSTFRNPTCRSFSSPLLSLRSAFLHSGLENQNVVKSICNSLRVGCNWDSLTEKFGSIGLDDSLVERILLELREPVDARRALGFFHWSAQRVNLVHGVYPYCIMAHILVGAQLITDARALLESVLKRSRAAEHDSRFEVVDSLLDSYRVTVSNPLVFNLLVQGYAKLRMLEIGFEVCCYLESHGFFLTLISYNTLLHFVQKSHETKLLWKVYECMICRRIYPDEATIRTMIDGLCKEGKLQELVRILDRINGKRSSSCSPLVIVSTGLVLRILEEEEEEGRIEAGMGLLRLMLQKNMIMDTVAFSLIVHAKVKLGDLSSAVQVLDEMLQRGFDANSFCYTSFVEGYCSCGRVEEAMNLLHEMKSTGLRPYRETFEHLVLGCAKTGRVKESLAYCSEMMSMSHLPSLSAFNEILAKVKDAIDANQANEILTCMMDKGFLPDEITYSRLMVAYAKEGKVEEALKLYYEMEYRTISLGESGFGSLISCLCDHGKVGEAGRLLKVMKDRGVRPGKNVYEALVGGHFDKGNEEIAAQLRKEMVLYEVEENLTVIDPKNRLW